MSDLIIQHPASVDRDAEHLFLLFHGVGSSAEDLRGLATALANRHAGAWVVIVQSPDACDLGQGWQWFSVRGVTPENRIPRVAAAMPNFVQAVAQWQQRSGLDASSTTLVGFSQGAIMALESTQVQPPVAGRVVAIAGRFAALPLHARPALQVHLMHGEADGVVPAQDSVQAHTQLQALQAQVTLDLFPGRGHGIDPAMAARLWELLSAGN